MGGAPSTTTLKKNRISHLVPGAYRILVRTTHTDAFRDAKRTKILETDKLASLFTCWVC